MPELLATTIRGMRCDAAGCDAEITGQDLDVPAGFDHYEALAERCGWTGWVGRTRRWYCPQHGPNPGHKMRPLTRRRGGNP